MSNHRHPAAALWRGAAAGHRRTGNLADAERCARTARLIEGRPSKADCATVERSEKPAPPHMRGPRA